MILAYSNVRIEVTNLSQIVSPDWPSITIVAHKFSDALLIKQMPIKQTGFVLSLKQNISNLVFDHQN